MYYTSVEYNISKMYIRVCTQVCSFISTTVRIVINNNFKPSAVLTRNTNIQTFTSLYLCIIL